MKRILAISVLATALMLMFAAPALALGPAYVDWADVQAHNAAVPSLDTPHKDYQLTTEKCAVCHSVHVAGWAIPSFGTSVSPEAATSELLLRTSVSNACTYCHIDTATGGKQIYTTATGGNFYEYDETNVDPASGPTSVTAGFGHNGHPDGHAECADCHSVHGASTINGAVSEKILKSGDAAAAGSDWGRAYQTEFTTDKGAIDASADRNLQITGFCSKCHGSYSGASEDTITGYGYFGPIGSYGGNQVNYKNHPLKAAETTFSAQGSNVTTTVAFAGSEYCRSCHSAGTDGSTSNTGIITSSFPHWTPGNEYFLEAATDAAAAKQGVGAGSAGEDGVCLQCHRDGSGAGVGLNF